MKNILNIISAFILISFISTACAQEVKEEKKDIKVEEKVEVKGTVVDDGVLYGADLNKDLAVVSIADLIAKPDEYIDKTVKVSGKITDVCQGMGCWMILSDGTNSVKIMTMHKFFMPKDAEGNVMADGVFKTIEETEEHAREMLKESRNPNMKPEDIKGPQKVYIVQATGVKILK